MQEQFFTLSIESKSLFLLAARHLDNFHQHHHQCHYRQFVSHHHHHKQQHHDDHHHHHYYYPFVRAAESVAAQQRRCELSKGHCEPSEDVVREFGEQ